MQNSAVRALSKFNRNVIQNSRRLYSYKFEMTAAGGRPAAEPSAPEELPEKPTGFRYNVYQPRTSPVDRPVIAGDVALQNTVRAAIDEQNLQPAMLPEYFQKHMEKNSLMNPNEEHTESDRILNGGVRRFQVSKTCANAPPLKSVKLASPFPEPVKMMMSRTVADDEKAEQMLAEARSQRYSRGGSSRNISTSTRRFYSSSGKTVGSDPNKCKKLGDKGKKGCPRMVIEGCPPRARTHCDRLAKQVDCKKQECPYPAYSEFCHEDIEEKPSECKMCPWKPEENPNFKPQKKNMHTSVPSSIRRRGLESDGTRNEEIVPDVGDMEGMQCDLRKPPCERPKNRRCPPSKEKKEEKKPPKKKKRECAERYVKNEILKMNQQTDDVILARGCGDKPPEKERCRFPKFKFPPCEDIQKEDQTTGICPKKPRKPKVKDCPGDRGKKCAGIDQLAMELSGDQDDKKCPKIDMTVDKNMVPEDDPCHLKKKGTTKICPGDLLKKKGRKPRKKTSAPVTPSGPKGGFNQPSANI